MNSLNGLNSWLIMYRKEWLELMRSYKLVWVPIVFILIGASQPVMTYFLPDILASAGNMPSGMVIQIPEPKPSEVMGQTLGQFGLLGLLVIALVSMAAISGERISGTAAMILVKPVSYFAFVTSKWAALVTLSLLSFAAGYGASWYYTSVLFAPVGWREALGSLLLFALWLSFIVTLTLFFSAVLRSAAAAAFSALAVAVLLTVTASMLPRAFQWSPGRLSELAASHVGSMEQEGLWLVVAATLVLIIVLLSVAAGALRRRPSLEG